MGLPQICLEKPVHFERNYKMELLLLLLLLLLLFFYHMRGS